ncbi:FAD-dependent monooxygenase [Streptomyces griseorubiginosus]|uniref:FAD-dependent monooxygenase n=1 Tax=Streptomyces griseorubiginosus TaxID=67304 RepID=UPI001AD63F82|nr:FAD-dependent monooxygenase [Streptomyces griseorubiginosus]MBO4259550.1 pentachlorophenol monooxygenase [Streptomyces griseorubiginosus]
MTTTGTSGLEAPVAVIGNGPVGQTAALLLARWGLPVIILDQRPARDLVGSKAIAQQRDVLDVWDTLDGAGRQIADEGVTWSRSRTFYRERELFSTQYTGDGSAFPPFVNISQSRTEQILDERIARQPLIEARWDHEVTGLVQHEDHVELACDTPGGTAHIRAAYVLACPGARGHGIRDCLGVEFSGRTFSDQFLICDIRADVPGWERERRFYFDPEWNPGRQVLIHPCPDSTYRIDWQVPEDFDLAAEESGGGLDRRIRTVIGDRPYQIRWKSVYRFHSRIASQFRVARVLLAGDAAHLVSPFGGRGLNSGVQDAENAAWKVAAVLHGMAGEALLDSYHHERHAAAQENLAVTAATMEFLTPQTPAAQARRRDILERSVLDPAVRADVNSGRLAEPFWYVDSPLTTPDPARPFGGRPPKGSVPAPGPGVLMPDVPIVHPVTAEATRLRLLVRRRFTVITGDDVDVAALHGQLLDLGRAVPVHRIADLAGGGAAALGIKPDEAWVIRPDAHLAATLADPAAVKVNAAITRALGAGITQSPPPSRRTSSTTPSA